MSFTRNSSSIVFVDTSITNYQIFVDQAASDAQVVLLDPTQDALDQISVALAERVGLLSIHVVSHGSQGSLQLGSTVLDAVTLSQRKEQIAAWSDALAPGADILLYGCNVAHGAVGQNFVQSLAQLTGADVAASVNLTGNHQQGADWNLEYTAGSIEAGSAFHLAGLEQRFTSVLAAFSSGTIVVLRVGDGAVYSTGASAPVFLDEYDLATNQLVQTIAVSPSDVGSHLGLTLSISAAYEGTLGLSSDGRYLTFGGYNAEPGTASISNSAPATVKRVIARVDSSGVVDTTTSLNDSLQNAAGGIRSVVSVDGTGFWVGGGNGGVRFVSYGGTAGSTQIASGLATTRALRIFNNQLYVSADTTGFRPVNAVGTGVSSATGQALTPLLSGGVGPNGALEFVLLDRDATVAGVDTLYVAAGNSLYKYSFDGSDWTARSSYAAGNTFTGLTGRVNGAEVELFAVLGITSGNGLVRLKDTAAFDANFSVGSISPIATAGTNRVFRGLSFAPVPPVPMVSIEAIANSAFEAVVGSKGTFRIARNGSTTSALVVTLNVSGAAEANVDYAFSTGSISGTTYTVTIPVGASSIDVDVTPITDSDNAEGNEAVSLDIAASPSNYSISSVAGGATVTIADNRSPVLSVAISDQSGSQGAPFSFTIPGGTFSDADNHPLSYAATLLGGGALPTWLSFNGSTQQFDGTPGNADVGDLTIQVTVTDPYGAIASDVFVLAIANMNDVPVVSQTISSQTATSGQSFTFQVPETTFTDPDSIYGDTLTYSATRGDGTALPAWLTFNPSTRAFSGTPTNANAGSFNVRVIARDSQNATTSTTFGLTVNAVNNPPIVNQAIAVQTVNAGSPFSYVVPSTTFSDPDSIYGDTLTYSATRGDGTALPAWLTFNPSTRAFSGTPTNANAGSF
ncbi:putative Ig domain-containing protein, partial [Leptolyngbya sp. AN02str]|uniref:putative Ig domain-containing protein n=1 Tax=Leptolyngbya sp. AN02str TaxID=3423363 RepID=UPI003D31C0F1